MIALRAVAVAIWLALASAAAQAGPPFLTDDPEPTETGHWEIYAPYVDIEGRGSELAGSAGAEINYGPAPGVQLTVGLPIAYAHDPSRWEAAEGDLELSVKYRFYHDDKAGLSIAAFPGITLPTAGKGLGAGRVTALLPVWAQKDWGRWSVFGGGGYALNPGAGNRNYWTGGVAVTRQFSEKVLLGLEIDRQGAESIGGSPSTSAGLGAILRLGGPFRILASGGPRFDDGGGSAAFHGFFAIGMDF